MSYARLSETGLTADEIWKLEQQGLASQDEITWRKREDVRSSTTRPEPPPPPWKPLTAEEFEAKVGKNAFGSTFAMDAYGFYQAYNDYLRGFYTELGRRKAAS